MNIKIGAKIKALRKRDDITQEQLAESLGVSNQAISRWESESGYPDIEYITPLANLFNVTIDYLFDHDTAEKRRRIEDYLTQFSKRKYEEPYPGNEQIELMRRALAEFPAEESLLINLAEALYWKWISNGLYWTSNERNGPDVEKNKSFGCWEESVKIMEGLLATSTDDIIRGQCRYNLATIYGAIGEKEKLLAVAEQCGTLYNSKEHILARASLGEDGIKSKQELVGLLPHILQNILITRPDLPENANTDTEIEKYDFLIRFWKFIYRGDYGVYNEQVAALYNCYARILYETKPEEAVEAFEQSFVFAKMQDELAGVEAEKTYTSPYLNRIKYKLENFPSRRRVCDLLKWLKNDKYQSLRENERFAAMVKEAEAWVAERG
ncbi:MAG: helix-turn-helix domain-containing protein [Oscillospiraceae bacterium]|nr:helix-turn-helix domain-containing protein [Oscillospiraceae bacterium]